MRDDWNSGDPFPEHLLTEPLLDLMVSLVMLGPAEATNEDLEPGRGSEGPLNNPSPECRRAQDAKRDIQVPFSLPLGDILCCPGRPAVAAALHKAEHHNAHK
jgi:hypothetical protein